MDVELERAWFSRLIVVLLVLLLLVLYAVGHAYTPYDGDGRAVLLSRDMLVTRSYLQEADRLTRELNRIASDLDRVATPPQYLSSSHEDATPVAGPSSGAGDLLTRVQTTTVLLCRVQDVAVEIERLNPPPALRPIHERLLETARATARWGTAVADYLTSPSQERWKRVRKERRHALRLLGDVREALK